MIVMSKAPLFLSLCPIGNLPFVIGELWLAFHQNEVQIMSHFFFFLMGLNFFFLHVNKCFLFWAPVIPWGILFLATVSNIKFNACHINYKKHMNTGWFLYFSIVRAFYWIKVIKYILTVLFLGSFY